MCREREAWAGELKLLKEALVRKYLLKKAKGKQPPFIKPFSGPHTQILAHFCDWTH